MSNPSFANTQSVPAVPSAASPPCLRWHIVNVGYHASEEDRRVVRGYGVGVENRGWAASPSSASSSSPPSDCSSPSSSDGQLEPASGPSRRAKQSKATRRKAAGPRTRNKTSSDVARPSNCFLLFRNDFTVSEKGKAYLKSLDGKQNNISRIAGAVWREMSEEDKEPYRRRQEALALEHKLKHPDYQFAPGRRGPTKKRNNKNKDLEKALAEYVAGLHQQGVPANAIDKAVEVFKYDFNAKQASASPPSSPERSPVEPSSSAFVDPLYPPGDRTPQPRPAHPVVIELPPAPTPEPSSASTSAPSSSSSVPYALVAPPAYPPQPYNYDMMSVPAVAAPASWSVEAPVPPYFDWAAYHSASTQPLAATSTYQLDTYQQNQAGQDAFDFTFNVPPPLDAYPVQQPATADQLAQQRLMMPDLPPALFDGMTMSMPTFDQPAAANPQDVTFDTQAAYQPQFYQEFAPQQQYPTGSAEQQSVFPAVMDVPGLGDYTGFDVGAMQEDLAREQQQFLGTSMEFLDAYYQGVNAQWNQ